MWVQRSTVNSGVDRFPSEAKEATTHNCTHTSQHHTVPKARACVYVCDRRRLAAWVSDDAQCLASFKHRCVVGPPAAHLSSRLGETSASAACLGVLAAPRAPHPSFSASDQAARRRITLFWGLLQGPERAWDRLRSLGPGSPRLSFCLDLGKPASERACSRQLMIGRKHTHSPTAAPCPSMGLSCIQMDSPTIPTPPQ